MKKIKITIDCTKHGKQPCRETSPTSMGCSKCFKKGKLV